MRWKETLKKFLEKYTPLLPEKKRKEFFKDVANLLVDATDEAVDDFANQVKKKFGKGENRGAI